MHKKCHSFCGLGVRAVPQVSGTTARTFFGEDPEQSNPSLGLPWRSRDTGEPQEPGQGGAWIFWQLYLSDPHLYFFRWLHALGSSLSAGSFGENHRSMGWETRWRQKERQVATSGPAQKVLSSGSFAGTPGSCSRARKTGHFRVESGASLYQKTFCLWATLHQHSFRGPKCLTDH